MVQHLSGKREDLNSNLSTGRRREEEDEEEEEEKKKRLRTIHIK
jgi:hypothetical protein